MRINRPRSAAFTKQAAEQSSRCNIAAPPSWCEGGGVSDIPQPFEPQRRLCGGAARLARRARLGRCLPRHRPQTRDCPGERWEGALHKAAWRCEAVLFLVSESWLASGWCRKEFHLAHRLNKHLFGGLIEDIPIACLRAEMIGTWQLVPLVSGRAHILPPPPAIPRVRT
jgi:hypothetical protein